MKCPQKVRQNYEHNLFKQPKGPAVCGSQTAGAFSLALTLRLLPCSKEAPDHSPLALWRMAPIDCSFWH